MKKSIIQILKFLTFLVLGVLLIWLAFRGINFSKLSEGLKNANYFWVILSIIFSVFAFLSRTRRWILMIHPLGFNPSFKNTLYSVMTGYLANMALPRIGEVSKCVSLGKKENIPVERLIGTVVIERVIDFISLLLITLIMIILEGDIIGPFLINNIYNPIHQKITSLFGFAWIFWLLLVVIFFGIIFLTIKLRHKLRKIRFFSKIFNIAEGITHGLKTITIIERKWEFIFHTVFIWINYVMMTWVMVFAIESTSGLKLSDAFFLLVIGGLAMSAPVQNGLGAFHLIISQGLLVVYGIALEDGLVYAILTHESQMIFIVITGAISFFALVRKEKKVDPQTPLQGG